MISPFLLKERVTNLNNRSTNVVTFDTVDASAVATDYVVYENATLKAPHGLRDLINNDRQHCRIHQ